MVVYLTFNDQPSGVYASQVVDVVNFLDCSRDEKVRLVAFVSLRGYIRSRKKIKSICPTAVVLPMFPGVKNWRANRPLLSALLSVFKPRVVIARGVFASALALNDKRTYKVVFDARGAYHAEFSEYRVVNNDEIIASVKHLEEQAIRESDAQLAVSQALLDYWNEAYGIDRTKTAEIIPCTLPQNTSFEPLDESERQRLRQEHGISPDDVLLVYSGSAAGWQSFTALFNWLAGILSQQAHVRLLLMTSIDSLENTPLAVYADRVLILWVEPHQVSQYLSMGDYGLLLREVSVTNRVASPTKFAEYLAAGLQVVISPHIGDFSEFVEKHGCGLVISDSPQPQLTKVIEDQRNKSFSLAQNHFTKRGYDSAYNRLLE